MVPYLRLAASYKQLVSVVVERDDPVSNTISATSKQ
jgi:hypothetical protein